MTLTTPVRWIPNPWKADLDGLLRAAAAMNWDFSNHELGAAWSVLQANIRELYLKFVPSKKAAN